MNKIHQNKIIIRHEDGEEKEYYILFTLSSSETKKDYLVYSDIKDNNKHERYVHADTYTIDDLGYHLEPIATDKEWDTIMSILCTVQLNESAGR